MSLFAKLFSAVSLLLVLFGCVERPPESVPETDETEETPSSALADPEHLLIIFAADQVQEEAVRLPILRRHGILDATGEEKPEARHAHARALLRFARRQPERWQTFLFQKRSWVHWLAAHETRATCCVR